MEAILTVNNLKTTFLTGSGAVQAVRGISFQVGKGEIVGIVGESGSGKSVSSMSILRLLPGTARIDRESSIVFDGQELTGLTPKQLRQIRAHSRRSEDHILIQLFQIPFSQLIFKLSAANEARA